ncbi:MAG: twin transmembrane helix small protein [Sphingomonas sp.]
MNPFLAILLVAAMIATLVALVRGLATLVQRGEATRRGESPEAIGIRSNKLMQARIFFQALAIMMIVLILFLAGRT